VAVVQGLQQTQAALLGQAQVLAPCFRGVTDQRAAQGQEHLLVVQTQLLEAQEEAQEEGFLLLQRLDLQGALEELRLALGLAVELQMEEQLGATAHLLQTLQQVLLLVAAQAEAADLASLATLATAATEEPTVAQVEEVEQGLILLETLAQVATERMALLLSQPTSNYEIRYC
jgi:hypothetical protein